MHTFKNDVGLRIQLSLFLHFYLFYLLYLLLDICGGNDARMHVGLIAFAIDQQLRQ